MEEDPKKAAIASRLVLARKQAGLTQGQVAEILDLSRPSVSEFEAGRRNVTATELSRLAEMYGVSTAWLSCSDEDNNNPQQDRLHLAARQLSKLKTEDLDKVLNLLNALRDEGGLK